MFQIGEKQINIRQRGFDRVPRHMQTGFNGSMYALFVAGFEQRVGQSRVHKRLAAGECDTAAAAIVKGFITQHGGHNIGDLLLLTAYGHRLRRAAIGEGVKRCIVEFFAMNNQSIQRAVDNPWRSLLAEVAAFQAQAGIKQDVSGTRTALRILTPAAA
ncbi:hypothetical protein D3C80_1624740 [compost metagenome]